MCVVQNGKAIDAKPATIKPMLLTSNGDINGSLAIHPEANRMAVLLKPSKGHFTPSLRQRKKAYR